MRPALSVISLALLSAAAPAPVRDWSAHATATPQGAYVVGNPAARTKIVEYASYTCSHCAHFAAEAKPALTQRIRSGSTSLELRHMVRDPLDLAAGVVARCGGAKRFRAVSDAIFAGQEQWLPRGAAYAQSNAATLRAAAPTAQVRALAEGAGLLAIGRANGLTGPALDACFADRAGVDRAIAARGAVPPEVRGTPAFFVNGRFVATSTWAGLQPALGPAS